MLSSLGTLVNFAEVFAVLLLFGLVLHIVVVFGLSWFEMLLFDTAY